MIELFLGSQDYRLDIVVSSYVSNRASIIHKEMNCMFLGSWLYRIIIASQFCIYKLVAMWLKIASQCIMS